MAYVQLGVCAIGAFGRVVAAGVGGRRVTVGNVLQCLPREAVESIH